MSCNVIWVQRINFERHYSAVNPDKQNRVKHISGLGNRVEQNYYASITIFVTYFHQHTAVMKYSFENITFLVSQSVCYSGLQRIWNMQKNS